MQPPSRPPAGPRGVRGAAAEEAVARYLRSRGWTILARNLRVGRDELDIVALEPGPPVELVMVEVRSGTSPRFGSPSESVDARKVARIYRAATTLRRQGYPGLGLAAHGPGWRVDLLTVVSDHETWRIETHLRGLEPS